MKKKLLLSILIAGTLNVLAQSIPNGGFENWIYSSFEDPMYYMSSNDNTWNNNPSPMNVVKTTDSYHLMYAVKLTTILQGNDTMTAYFANGDPTNPGGQGIPYNQNANGLRFYYKCNIMSGDTGLVIAMFKKSGATIGTFIKKITGAQNNYTLGTMSFTLPMAPDTIVFAATPSNALSNNFRGIPGSMLQLDSITYTGVSSQPVNFNGDLESWQTITSKTPVGWSMNSASQIKNFQTNDFYSGAYALELKTRMSGSYVYSDGATNGVPSPSTTLGGSPFSNQNDTLVFYYKYAPNDPNDSAAYYLNFKKNFVTFSGFSGLLPASATYKKVKVTINLSMAPDTMLIFLNSSKSWSLTASYAGADFKIDNMYLTSQVVPVTNFSVMSTACTSNSFQLMDNSSNLPTAYSWTMTGATPSTSTLQNPIISYSGAGTYTIMHNTSNSFGSGSVITRTITINPTPTISVNSASICSGQSVNLFAGGGNTYLWSSSATTSSISVSPSSSASYTVTGTSAAGCSNNAISNITVNTPPTLTLTNSSPICAGTSTNVFISGAATYSWSTGATTNSISVSPSVTTQYSVVGTSSAGCQNTASVSVTVNTQPTLSVTGPNNLCVGNTIILNVTGASTYTWAAGPTTSTLAVNPIVNTSYSVTGTAANGCMNTAYMTVTVNPLPIITATSNSSLICVGQSATLTANGGISYTWTPGGVAGSIVTSPTTTSTYSIIGKDANGCTNTTQFTQSVSACTGINEEQTNGTELIVFPNPNNGSFTLKSKDDDRIIITNELGQTISAVELNNDNGHVFSLEDLTAGIYFASGTHSKFKIMVIN